MRCRTCRRMSANRDFGPTSVPSLSSLVASVTDSSMGWNGAGPPSPPTDEVSMIDTPCWDIFTVGGASLSMRSTGLRARSGNWMPPKCSPSPRDRLVLSGSTFERTFASCRRRANMTEGFAACSAADFDECAGRTGARSDVYLSSEKGNGWEQDLNLNTRKVPRSLPIIGIHIPEAERSVLPLNGNTAFTYAASPCTVATTHEFPTNSAAARPIVENAMRPTSVADRPDIPGASWSLARPAASLSCLPIQKFSSLKGASKRRDTSVLDDPK